MNGIRLLPLPRHQHIDLRVGIAVEPFQALRNQITPPGLELLEHRWLERPNGVDDVRRLPVQELAEFRLEQLLAARIERRACDLIHPGSPLSEPAP